MRLRYRAGPIYGRDYKWGQCKLVERQVATRQKVTHVARGRFDPNKVSSRNFVNPPLEAHARKQGCKKERWIGQRKFWKPEPFRVGKCEGHRRARSLTPLQSLGQVE